MTKDDFPKVIDSTMLAAYKSCPQKFFRTYVQHWKPLGNSVHLHAGKSFASGLEAARKAYYEEGKGELESVQIGKDKLAEEYGDFECPQSSGKSLFRMLGALDYYFEAWPLAQDPAPPLMLPNGRRAIEFSFAQPFPVNHPTTGEPLIYSGRADMISTYAGAIYIEDDKTTSQLGVSWGKQFILRSQFTAYCWMAQQMGIDVAGFLVRGLAIRKAVKATTPAYDSAQEVVARPQWMIDEWLMMSMDIVNDMVRDWKREYWRKNLDSACGEYGGCGLLQICASPRPDEWLRMEFQRKRWEPLTRTETILEDV